MIVSAVKQLRTSQALRISAFMDAVKPSSSGWMEYISLNRRSACSGVTLYRNTCLTWCSRAADRRAAPSSKCACQTA